MSLEDDLLRIEKKLWIEGPDAYRQHVDDQCVVVFTGMARVMPKDDIARTAEKGRWRDVSIARKGMTQLSDSSAVIAYECNAKRKTGKTYHAFVSSAYVSRPDGWKLAFHQQTAL